MTNLVIRVVGNVLELIAIENLQAGSVTGGRRIQAAEFIVLLPEIRLDQFRGGKELKNGDVPPRKTPWFRFARGRSEDLGRTGEQACPRRKKNCAEAEISKKRAPGKALGR